MIIPVMSQFTQTDPSHSCTKTPPAAVLIKAAGIDKASGSLTRQVASITYQLQAEEIEDKMQDLNAATLEATTDMIRGCCSWHGSAVTE